METIGYRLDKEAYEIVKSMHSKELNVSYEQFIALSDEKLKALKEKIDDSERHRDSKYSRGTAVCVLGDILRHSRSLRFYMTKDELKDNDKEYSELAAEVMRKSAGIGVCISVGDSGYVTFRFDEKLLDMDDNYIDCIHINIKCARGNLDIILPSNSYSILVCDKDMAFFTHRWKDISRHLVGMSIAADGKEYRVYEMHAYDEVVEITRDTLNMCDRALDAYNEYTRESVKHAESTPQRGLEAESHKSESTDMAVGEYFVTLSNGVKLDRNSVRHVNRTSPIAHMVPGYWRKRSKKDPTRIFIQAFPRGGTEKEREEMRKNPEIDRQKTMIVK